MEIEMELDVAKDELAVALERMNAGLDLQGSNTGDLQSDRERELERRLAEAEATIESLRAEAAARSSARKTAPAGAAAFAAREGVAVEAGSLDGALRSLSIEQRIAVKSELLRTGLIG